MSRSKNSPSDQRRRARRLGMRPKYPKYRGIFDFARQMLFDRAVDAGIVPPKFDWKGISPEEAGVTSQADFEAFMGKLNGATE